MSFEIIDLPMLAALSREAEATPRRRKNLNFHAGDASRCARLVYAVAEGSYVRPHRHLDPEKGETVLCLRGRFGLLFFADDGTVSATRVIAAGSDCLGVNVAPGTWHSLLALEPESVFFEAKAGPYCPLSPAETAAWAPAENTAEAIAYEARLRRLFD